MPRWVARIVWACRGKRMVRLHLSGDADSVEGVLVGRWGGHYVLLLPKLVEGEEQVLPLEGSLEVPAERVVYVQVLAR